MSNIMSECYKGISTSLIKDDYVHEVCRYGAAEPHAMAALIGGCAAHEAIKLLTKQYVPVDNLFLFNSMTMNTVTLKAQLFILLVFSQPFLIVHLLP